MRIIRLITSARSLSPAGASAKAAQKAGRLHHEKQSATDFPVYHDTPFLCYIAKTQQELFIR